MPASAKAATIAPRTASLSSSRAQANTLGPLPDSEAPRAPAWKAAAFTDSKPGTATARWGSIRMSRRQ